MRIASPAILALLLLAGCANPPPQPATEEGPTIITDPNDGRLDPSMGAHLHDP